MQHFLIAVDKHGVRAFRLRDTTVAGEEVTFHATELPWNELELMQVTTPSLVSFLTRFTAVLVELGHLVTRMRLEEGTTWRPDEVIEAAAAQEPAFRKGQKRPRPQPAPKTTAVGFWD